MDFPEGKYAWMVKIGEKGQFVIPKYMGGKAELRA